MFTRLLKIAISQPVAGGGQCKFTGLARRVENFLDFLIKISNNVVLELFQMYQKKCGMELSQLASIQIKKERNNLPGLNSTRAMSATVKIKKCKFPKFDQSQRDGWGDRQQIC